MDIVLIEQLTVMTVIGVYDWERQRTQKLVFDLEMGWNHIESAHSNTITNCLNYSEVADVVTSLVSSKNYFLIEHVAEETAERLMTQFKLPWIRIKICKPSALPQAVSAGIIIERGNKTDLEQHCCNQYNNKINI